MVAVLANFGVNRGQKARHSQITTPVVLARVFRSKPVSVKPQVKVMLQSRVASLRAWLAVRVGAKLQMATVLTTLRPGYGQNCRHSQFEPGRNPGAGWSLASDLADPALALVRMRSGECESGAQAFG